jgi:hypothetical protein
VLTKAAVLLTFDQAIYSGADVHSERNAAIVGEGVYCVSDTN